MTEITIGALARAASVHVETIRFYQQRGLLATPKRPEGGVRRYGQDAVSRLRFIRRAQDVGFTLEEIRELLRLERGGRGAHTLAVAKLASIEQRIKDLRGIRRTLRHLIESCEAGTSHACPIIEALAAKV